MKHRKGHWLPEATAESNACRELPLFLEEYFAEGRKAARKGANAEKLHEFRLATKHFRYLLELFLPLYGPSLEDFFQHLRKVQTLLGELNDYSVTRSMIEEEEKKKQGEESSRFFTYLETQHKKKLAEFRRYWKEEVDPDGAERRWKIYLSRTPRRPAPRKRTVPPKGL